MFFFYKITMGNVVLPLFIKVLWYPNITNMLWLKNEKLWFLIWANYIDKLEKLSNANKKVIQTRSTCRKTEILMGQMKTLIGFTHNTTEIVHYGTTLTDGVEMCCRPYTYCCKRQFMPMTAAYIVQQHTLSPYELFTLHIL